MKYRMLAIDLDGTLFDSSGNVPQPNREAVDRAREAGALVVLATGRGLCESRGAIEALRHEGPVVLAGGALVADPTTSRTLHRALVEASLARQVVEYLRRRDHAVLVLLDPDPADHDYLIINGERLTENTRWWFSRIGAQIRYADEPSERDLHHALRVGMVGPAKDMPMIQAELVRDFGERIFVQHFMAVRQPDGEEVHVLEVFAAGVNKWSALRWLGAEHGVEPGETAAIGDHINDVAMVEAAGCGVAMANAVEPVRRAAHHTTGTNDACGVADAIDRMLRGEW